MEQIRTFLDERLDFGACVYCGGRLKGATTNVDHVPTKGLLDEPYPPNLPTVKVHTVCNSQFSADELFLVVLLGCVLAGTTDIGPETDPRTANRLGSNPRLRGEIAAARQVAFAKPGDPQIWWSVDPQRVTPVFVKNARGHVLFELGDSVLGSQKGVRFGAIELMDERRRSEFEDVHAGTDLALLPEIGSRSFVRRATGVDLVDGWVVVQAGVYRYSVVDIGDEIRVRSVIREYLATEVAFG